MPNFNKKSQQLFIWLAGFGSLLAVIYITILYISSSFIFSTFGEMVARRATVACGCQAITGNINYPLFGLVSLLAIALLLTVIRAIGKTVSAYIKTRQFLSAQKTKGPNISAKLLSVSQALGIENKVIEIASSQPTIFCQGIRETHIYISSAVVAQLNKEELRAVLLHEMYHAKNQEPKKILFIQFLRGFKWIPGVKKIIKKYISTSEIAADELATDNFTNKHSLASVMAKILEMEEKNHIQKELAVSYFSQMTEERILVLSNASYQPQLVKEFLKTGLSIAAGIIVLFFLSGLVEKQEVRAQEVYGNSRCANKIIVEHCKNLWTNCAGEIFHKSNTACAPVDKSYIQK